MERLVTVVTVAAAVAVGARGNCDLSLREILQFGRNSQFPSLDPSS